MHWVSVLMILLMRFLDSSQGVSAEIGVDSGGSTPVQARRSLRQASSDTKPVSSYAGGMGKSKPIRAVRLRRQLPQPYLPALLSVAGRTPPKKKKSDTGSQSSKRPVKQWGQGTKADVVHPSKGWDEMDYVKAIAAHGHDEVKRAFKESVGGGRKAFGQARGTRTVPSNLHHYATLGTTASLPDGSRTV